MNILIVEDDTMLRNWLSMLLSSLSTYELNIYESGDGVEALELCQHTPIELVITDIKMPRMDGLQLIQCLRQRYPHIRTAVLSSYDDFSFVKEALRQGALDYILKAEMTVKDLSQLLDKVQNDFQVEHNLTSGVLPDYHAILDRQRAVVDFLASRKSDHDLLHDLSVDSKAPAIAVIFIHLQSQTGTDVPVFEAADICSKTMAAEGLQGSAVPCRRGNCLLLYGCSDSVAEFQKVEAIKLSSLVENNLQKYLHLPVCFSFYQFCWKGDALLPWLQSAYKRANCRRYYGDAVKCVDVHPTLSQWKSKIQRALDGKSFQEAVSYLRAALNEAHSTYLEPDVLRSNLLMLMNLFVSAASSILRNEKNSSLGALHACLVAVTQAENRQSLEDLVSTFCREFLSLLHQQQLSLSPAVRSALDYVDQHYSEKFSLDAVAEHVFMNRSYFCQLFKKEVGQTFGDYVEQVRIQKAKQLLASTGLSILNVSEKCGFSNQAYFTKVFKNATDISPLRYRRLHFKTPDIS